MSLETIPQPQDPARPKASSQGDPSPRDWFEQTQRTADGVDKIAAEIVGLRSDVSNYRQEQTADRGRIDDHGGRLSKLEAVESVEKERRREADKEREIRDAREDERRKAEMEKRKAQQEAAAKEKRREDAEKWKKIGLIVALATSAGAGLMKLIMWLYTP